MIFLAATHQPLQSAASASKAVHTKQANATFDINTLHSDANSTVGFVSFHSYIMEDGDRDLRQEGILQQFAAMSLSDRLRESSTAPEALFGTRQKLKPKGNSMNRAAQRKKVQRKTSFEDTFEKIEKEVQERLSCESNFPDVL